MFLLHLLPAFFIDTIAVCFGQKPRYVWMSLWTLNSAVAQHFFSCIFRLLKTYKKIHKFSNVISFFCTNEWTFTNNNTQKLWTKLGPVDQEIFHFNIQTLHWKDYLTFYIKGMRVYLFKDDLSNVEAARTKWNR